MNRLKTQTEVHQMFASQQCLAAIRTLRKMILNYGAESVKSREVKDIISDIGDIQARIEKL
jgi:hypothetical protein